MCINSDILRKIHIRKHVDKKAILTMTSVIYISWCGASNENYSYENTKVYSKAYVLYYYYLLLVYRSICEIGALGPIFARWDCLLILDSHEFPVVGSSTRSRSRPNHSPPSPSSFSVRCLQVGRPCGRLATVRSCCST